MTTDYEKSWPGRAENDDDLEPDDWVPGGVPGLSDDPGAVSEPSELSNEEYIAQADSATLDRIVVGMLACLEGTPVEARGAVVQSANAFALLSVGRALRERTTAESAPPQAWKLDRTTGQFQPVEGMESQ